MGGRRRRPDIIVSVTRYTGTAGNDLPPRLHRSVRALGMVPAVARALHASQLVEGLATRRGAHRHRESTACILYTLGP